MTITVTAQDIEEGRKFDPDNCAVARALRRAGVAHLGVMGPSVMVGDTWGGVMAVPLPTSARHWILDYDAGKDVHPLSFDLTSPVASIKQQTLDAKPLTIDRSGERFLRPFSREPSATRPSCRMALVPELSRAAVSAAG